MSKRRFARAHARIDSALSCMFDSLGYEGRGGGTRLVLLADANNDGYWTSRAASSLYLVLVLDSWGKNHG